MSEWNFCDPDLDIAIYLRKIILKMSTENDEEKRKTLMKKANKAYDEWLEL